MINKDKDRYTIIEYLEQEFSSFDQSPFNEIDALILSQLCYLNLGEVVSSIKEERKWCNLIKLYKAELFEKLIDKTLTRELNLKLLQVICASPRYRYVKLNYFENKYDIKTNEQFCAVTFLLPNNHKIIAYRGTDLSINGWKEDFNMLFTSPVASQISAVKYLEKVAKKTKDIKSSINDITLVGHSKGGNLAVYSNAFCKEKIHQRIKTVYNLDGPDFPNDIVQNLDYISGQDKIIKIVPEGSMVGVLFENNRQPKIIKSHNLGFLQHDAFSWKCDKFEFVSSNKFDDNINYLDKTLNAFIYELEVEERKILVDKIFDLISILNIESLDEFALSAIREREKIAKALKDVDEETSVFMKEILIRFLTLSFKIRFANTPSLVVNSVINKFLEKVKET